MGWCDKLQPKGLAEDGGGRRWLRQTQSQQFSYPTKSICRLDSKTTGGTGFPQEGPNCFASGVLKGWFFFMAFKNQIPCCDIYHLSHSFTKFNNCPQTITSFPVPSWNPAALWGFWNNQNQWFFHSEFFSHTQNHGCLVLISSNPQNQLLASEFLNYLELVFIKKIKCPPNTGF